MSRASRLSSLFVFLVVFTQASIALAAPTGWKSIDVTLQSEQQRSVLLVSGELPSTAKLPQEAELAVPAGTQLQWVGEILGGDSSKDPELKYTKSSVNGMDVYQFTLTTSRVAQIEGAVPSATSFDGKVYLTALKWTAWNDVPEVRISQRVPKDSTIVKADPGASVQAGPANYSYYTKSVTGVTAGQPVELSFSYSLLAPGSATAGVPAAKSSDSVALVVIMLVGVGGLGFVAYKVRGKMRADQEVESPALSRSSASPSKASAPSRQQGRRQVEVVEKPVPKKKIKPIVPMLAVVAALLVGVAIAGANGTSAVVVDGKISRNFGAASACQSASVAFTTNQGVDLAKQGDLLFKGLEGMEGVGEITIDLAQSKIDMAWCESSQSEESMRQALSSTGLVSLGQGQPVSASMQSSATVDASGKKQSVDVDTSTGAFSPNRLILQAGVPADVRFGKGEGCLTEVVMKDLGIRQDLTQGGATVVLPALDAGTYAFACDMGHQSGQIIVQ